MIVKSGFNIDVIRAQVQFSILEIRKIRFALSVIAPRWNWTRSAADWLSILLADFPMPRGNSGNASASTSFPVFL